MEITDIGQRIAKLRKENGYSQLELASRLNVSDKAVSKWENGGVPSIDLLPALSKLFNVSIDYLLKGNESDESTDENATLDNNTNDTKESKSVATPTVEDSGTAMPKKCICQKCGKLNVNPTDRCAYCYFALATDLPYLTEDEEEEYVDESLPAVLPNNFVCPKCGKVNATPDSYCIYCYHDFGTYTRGGAKKKNSDNRSSHKKSATGYRGNYGSNNTTNYTLQFQTATQKMNSVGCLTYLVAFLFPIVGLIWGIVKKENALIIFSAIMMLISFITCIISIFGLFI